MPETLCIAELADGRRALAYINPETREGRLVLVLRPEDLIPRSMRIHAQETPPGLPVIDMITGVEIGRFISARDLPIPTPPPPPRITADDLIQRGAQLAPGQPTTPEEDIIRDIQRLADDDPEAPSFT